MVYYCPYQDGFPADHNGQQCSSEAGPVPEASEAEASQILGRASVVPDLDAV